MYAKVEVNGQIGKFIGYKNHFNENCKWIKLIVVQFEIFSDSEKTIHVVKTFKKNQVKLVIDN